MATDAIRFRDAEFTFRTGGVTYRVHTEVGDGEARVIVEETEPETEEE